MKRSHQKFYTKLSATATARKNCGVYLYDGFLSPVEARDAFVLMGDDAEFPWDKNPDLDGERLDRHAYKHDRKKFSRDRKKKKQFEGLSRLEAICSKIERDFGMKVSYVCCNRFEDPDHRIDWHVDTFGEHICVLSLGSKRRIEFRNYETGEIDAVTPAAGDLSTRLMITGFAQRSKPMQWQGGISRDSPLCSSSRCPGTQQSSVRDIEERQAAMVSREISRDDGNLGFRKWCDGHFLKLNDSKIQLWEEVANLFFELAKTK
eukprot:jgi/Psemu1/292720/fgenesh1_pg.1247_\